MSSWVRHCRLARLSENVPLKLPKCSLPQDRGHEFPSSGLGPNWPSIIKAMRKNWPIWPGHACVLLALSACIVLTGCAGVSSGQKQGPNQDPPAQGGLLTVGPATLDFGTVAVGGTANLNGTLTAGTSDITVSSAGWNGSGFNVSGITFPVTIPAGQSVGYTVTFAPETAGKSSGTISFVNDGTTSPVVQTLDGNGGQAGLHTVSLSWDASLSTVIGYNVYRSMQSGGPYDRLTSSPQPGTSYTDSTVLSGTTYYYVATAVDSNQVESVHSNQATAVVP